MNKLLVLGCGGHGRVVADAAQKTGNWEVIRFLDDRYTQDTPVDGWTLIGNFDAASKFVGEYTHAVVGIGNNTLRLKLIDQLKAQGFQIPTVVHPQAVVSDHVSLGEGSVVFAGAVVNIGSQIGSGCIVNTSASVDHDCRLADGSHVAPGAHLSGNVTLGERSWVGTGASVKEGVSIASDVIVGVGAAVVKNVSDQGVVVGVPAQPLGK